MGDMERLEKGMGLTNWLFGGLLGGGKNHLLSLGLAGLLRRHDEDDDCEREFFKMISECRL
jgi:hypothetical protein